MIMEHKVIASLVGPAGETNILTNAMRFWSRFKNPLASKRLGRFLGIETAKKDIDIVISRAGIDIRPRTISVETDIQESGSERIGFYKSDLYCTDLNGVRIQFAQGLNSDEIARTFRALVTKKMNAAKRKLIKNGVDIKIFRNMLVLNMNTYERTKASNDPETDKYVLMALSWSAKEYGFFAFRNLKNQTYFNEENAKAVKYLNLVSKSENRDVLLHMAQYRGEYAYDCFVKVKAASNERLTNIDYKVLKDSQNIKVLLHVAQIGGSYGLEAFNKLKLESLSAEQLYFLSKSRNGLVASGTRDFINNLSGEPIQAEVNNLKLKDLELKFKKNKNLTQSDYLFLISSEDKEVLLGIAAKNIEQAGTAHEKLIKSFDLTPEDMLVLLKSECSAVREKADHLLRGSGGKYGQDFVDKVDMQICLDKLGGVKRSIHGGYIKTGETLSADVTAKDPVYTKIGYVPTFSIEPDQYSTEDIKNALEIISDFPVRLVSNLMDVLELKNSELAKGIKTYLNSIKR